MWSTRPLLDSLFGLCWCVTTLSNSQNEGAPNFGWLRFSGKQNSSLTFRHTVHCVHCKTQTETKKLKFNLSSCDIIFLQLVIIMNLLLISWRERQNSLWRLLPVHPNQCSSVYEFREFVTPDEAKVMRSVRFVCQSVCLSVCRITEIQKISSEYNITASLKTLLSCLWTAGQQLLVNSGVALGEEERQMGTTPTPT